MTGSQALKKPGGERTVICQRNKKGLHTSEFLKFSIVETAQIRAAIILYEELEQSYILGLYFTTDLLIDITDIFLKSILLAFICH